jgi:hypothetical protein
MGQSRPARYSVNILGNARWAKIPLIFESPASLELAEDVLAQPWHLRRWCDPNPLTLPVCNIVPSSPEFLRQRTRGRKVNIGWWLPWLDVLARRGSRAVLHRAVHIEHESLITVPPSPSLICTFI